MKALYAFIAVLFFTIYIPAQAANLAETKEPEKPDATKNALTKNSKVVVPPEKARPIKIPWRANPLYLHNFGKQVRTFRF